MIDEGANRGATVPRLVKRLPKYRKKISASGTPVAVVTLGGKDHYCGPYDAKASRDEYDRLVAEWLQAGRRASPRRPGELTVTQLVVAYFKHAQSYYRRSDGTSTETAENMRPAFRTLREMYGPTPISEFGPLSLKAVRQRFVDEGQARSYVNMNIDRLKRMIRWGVSEELVDESVLRRLETVEGLRRGRTDAREGKRVEPVCDTVVDKTLPHLPRIVGQMITLQRLTGMRPGEVCQMRPFDLERSRDTWLYIPERHKTEHHGKQRIIAIGPKAQTLLLPFLERPEHSPCFSPAEAESERLAARHAARTTPLSCGNRPGTNRKRRRALPPGDCYTNDSYRKAIHRACDKAFPAPKDATEAEERQWKRDHRWSPNQLRHSAATEIRARFGIEAVAAVLGHSKTDVSEIYAERDIQLACRVATELG